MKFLVVDAHPVLREGLAATLRQSFGPATVVMASNAEESYAAAARHDPLDAVLLDLGLPGLDGPQVISELRRRSSLSPIVVLSSSESIGDLGQAFSLGARGFIPKSVEPRILIAAIQLVIEGGLYIPSFALNGLDAGAPAAPPRITQPRAMSGLARLTVRQTEILTLMARGTPNGAIAAALRLSEKTVKTHITAILKALDAVNRQQAVSLARAAGLI